MRRGRISTLQFEPGLHAAPAGPSGAHKGLGPRAGGPHGVVAALQRWGAGQRPPWVPRYIWPGATPALAIDACGPPPPEALIAAYRVRVRLWLKRAPHARMVDLGVGCLCAGTLLATAVHTLLNRTTQGPWHGMAAVLAMLAMLSVALGGSRLATAIDEQIADIDAGQFDDLDLRAGARVRRLCSAHPVAQRYVEAVRAQGRQLTRLEANTLYRWLSGRHIRWNGESTDLRRRARAKRATQRMGPSARSVHAQIRRAHR